MTDLLESRNLQLDDMKQENGHLRAAVAELQDKVERGCSEKEAGRSEKIINYIANLELGLKSATTQFRGVLDRVEQSR